MIAKNKSFLTFLVAAFAAFLSTFNETFMNVALANMCTQLGVGFSTVQWLITAYMLGAAIMVPVSAFLFKKFPTKPLFLAIVSFFIVGSVVGVFAGNNFVLVLIARIIQSVASGLVFPTAINIILCVAPKEKLGMYMGTLGALSCLGPSISVVLAGFLLTIGDFHILFMIFGILSLICFVFGIFYVGNVGTRSNPKLDLLSVILIALGLVGVLFGLSYIFTNVIPAIIALVIGITASILFVVRQRKIPEPLINLSPLRNKIYTLSVIVCMLGYVAVFAFDVLIPQYLQTSLGLTSLIASLTLFPAIALSCVFAPIVGKMYDKYGVKWLLIIGFSLMAVFSAILAIFVDVRSAVLLGALYAPISVGSALIIDSVQSCGLSALKPDENAYGVTIFSMFFQITGCVGSSVFANIYVRLATVEGDPSANIDGSFMIVTAILGCIAFVGLILSFVLNKIKAKQVVKTPTKVTVNLDEIMKKDVFTVSNTATIREVITLFTDKGISGCPIVDGNNSFVGYISDGDIMRYLTTKHSLFKLSYIFSATEGEQNEFATKLKDVLELNVCDVASKDVFYVSKNDSLESICDVLATTHKKKVPVLENNKIIGVVTRGDISKYILRYGLALIK